MPAPDAPRFKFLDSGRHRLFACGAFPPPGAASSAGLVVCPPFAEEMNRCRRTVRLLCARAPALGIGVASVDLHGTGDSSGDFGDARWEQWLDDLVAAAGWLAAAGCGAPWLVGIRAGALLAFELARSARLPLAGLILWQPTLTGSSVVTDMLRARIAATAATAAAGERETTDALRRQLAAGESVEAAGYRLAPALVRSLETASVDGPALAMPATCWVEIGGGAQAPMRAAAAAAIGRLRASGSAVDVLRVEDPPFWGTTEVTLGRATVDATLAWLGRRA